MERVEFFVCNDSVWFHSQNGVEELNEERVEFIDHLFEKIKGMYPIAYNALVEQYSNSIKNFPYFKFLCVRRFCKCNFGQLDTTKDDIDANERFHFERICCPLRGECKYEGIICNPKFNSALSDAELRVMELVYKGKSVNEISEALYLSPNTIKNHKKSVYTKLGVRNSVEFVEYANQHNLFTNLK